MGVGEKEPFRGQQEAYTEKNKYDKHNEQFWNTMKKIAPAANASYVSKNRPDLGLNINNNPITKKLNEILSSSILPQGYKLGISSLYEADSTRPIPGSPYSKSIAFDSFAVCLTNGYIKIPLDGFKVNAQGIIENNITVGGKKDFDLFTVKQDGFIVPNDNFNQLSINQKKNFLAKMVEIGENYEKEKKTTVGLYKQLTNKTRNDIQQSIITITQKKETAVHKAVSKTANTASNIAYKAKNNIKNVYFRLSTLRIFNKQLKNMKHIAPAVTQELINIKTNQEFQQRIYSHLPQDQQGIFRKKNSNKQGHRDGIPGRNTKAAFISVIQRIKNGEAL